MRAEDKRLEVPITFDSTRITLAELFERLSAQSDVSITTPEYDSASGIEVAVFLSKVPLGDVMESLWSLVGYQHAVWEWHRSGKAGAYRYQLIQPASAKDLSASLHRQVQAAIEDEAITLLAALKLGPDERKKLGDRDENIKRMLADKRVMAGLQIFAESYPPEKQLAVLRGQQPPPIPVSQLSDQGKAYVLYEWKMAHATTTENGVSSSVPEPSWVQFQMDREWSQIVPILYMDIEGIGGNGYLGGTRMEKLFRDKIARGWLLPGDASDNPATKLKVKPPDKERLKPGNTPVVRLLERLAKGAPLSLMAILVPDKKGLAYASGDTPEDTRDWMNGPDNLRVGRFLDLEFRNMPYLMNKWCDNVLLVRSISWMMEEDTNAPYATRKQLRKAKREEHGFVPLTDLARAADSLTAAQLRGLADEFPEMERAADVRDLIALCHRRPELASDSGLHLSPDVLMMLRGVAPLSGNPYLEEGQATAIRLILQKIGNVDPPARAIVLQILTTDGKWISTIGFSQTAATDRI